MEKTNLIAGVMLVFSLGALVGTHLDGNEADRLRTGFMEKMENFALDMEWDVENGMIDSAVAGYYIHNFLVIHEQLMYVSEEYSEYRE